jgi:hypothetical protein
MLRNIAEGRRYDKLIGNYDVGIYRGVKWGIIPVIGGTEKNQEGLRSGLSASQGLNSEPREHEHVANTVTVPLRSAVTRYYAWNRRTGVSKNRGRG